MTEENKKQDQTIKPQEESVSQPTSGEAKVDVAAKIKSSKKKKTKNKVTKGKIYINSTYNNTIVSLTDMAGNVILWGSAGKIGFKGSKKSTPYAGQKTMEDVLAKLKERGLLEVDVLIKGIGSGRESAVRALQGSGLNILTIKDQTPIPHGGIRPKKPRRV
ncbi:MAG: 30S ribosomal protein S11 [Candidatus Doudnabacteria bacterium]|nr:30S ribosomal protein S11 [Candidatus Doudnabacteria bacterium]